MYKGGNRRAVRRNERDKPSIPLWCDRYWLALTTLLLKQLYARMPEKAVMMAQLHGDHEGFTSSWLQPYPVLTITALWGPNHQTEERFIFPSLRYPSFQIYKINLKKKGKYQ